MRTIRIAAVFLLLSSGLATAQEAGDKPPDPQARFWEARRVMLERDDPASAAELFRTIVSEHPKSDRADDALYWMGRCYLRVKDREPDAVVAFNRLLREHPESPFLDDAARELFRLGDKTAIPALLKRLEGGSSLKAAEMAARALAELGRAEGGRYLELREIAPRPAPPTTEVDKSVRAEVRALEAEVRRLRKEVEDAIRLLEKLLVEREKAAESKTPSENGDD